MSKRIDEQLRKVVQLARRAGPVTPPRDSESDDQVAQLEAEAKRLGSQSTPHQS